MVCRVVDDQKTTSSDSKVWTKLQYEAVQLVFDAHVFAQSNVSMYSGDSGSFW